MKSINKFLGRSVMPSWVTVFMPDARNRVNGQYSENQTRIGAGSALYGGKIFIFREEGVSLGSDFTEYGNITFEKDKLDAKAFELMKKLIGLGFLQVTPT